MRVVVLIPVGPGHERLCEEAAASAQRAAGTNPGPFDRFQCFLQPDPHGEGRGHTRNLALKNWLPEKDDWIFWLDADDLMAPDAFLGLQAALKADPSLEAVWGTISCFRGSNAPKERPAQNYPADYSDLIRSDPTTTLQSGFFVRREVMEKERWNEDLDAGEDFDLYLRLWKSYRCGKVHTVFMHNRRGEHSTGPRAANGRDWRRAVEAMLRRAQQEETRSRRLNG